MNGWHFIILGLIVSASWYAGGNTDPGNAHLEFRPDADVDHQCVRGLVVDDLVSNGFTIRANTPETVTAVHPASGPSTWLAALSGRTVEYRFVMQIEDKIIVDAGSFTNLGEIDAVQPSFLKPMFNRVMTLAETRC